MTVFPSAAPSLAPLPGHQGNPFPGLRSFEPDEDHLFFGREEQIDEVLRLLRQNRFLAVVGTSGSGKSSLIRSGLVPSLHSGFMTTAGSSWRVAIFRPGEDPIGNLATALADPEILAPGTHEPEDLELHRSLLEATLRRGDLGLVECRKRALVPPEDNLLVIADQFEELFRFKETRRLENAAEASAAFVKLLLEAAAQDAVPVYVVVTMRSEFVGHCTEFVGFAEAINRGQYLVPRMSRSERRAAITGPVAVAGATITPRLVTRLLNDVGEDPDQLPILQHALMRTWDDWSQNGRDSEPLDLANYEAVGRLGEALSRHAEEAWQELDADQREIAERMWKALTDPSGGGTGVRSPRTLSALAELTGAGEDELGAVIETFRLPGRSFLMPPAAVPLESDSIIDISHESLMRVWERLKGWMEEEARAAEIYRRLAKAAARYHRGEGGLWHDPDLQLALNWAEQARPTPLWAERYDPALEQALLFLEASRQRRDFETAQRERQRRRELTWAWRLAIFLGTAALLTTLVGLYALDRKTEAEAQERLAQNSRIEAIRQKERAEVQRSVAEERRLEAEEQRREAQAQRLVAQEQEREAERQRQQAERQRLEAEQQRRQAEEQKQKAEEQKRIAEAATLNARAQEQDALRAKSRAEAAQTEAERLRALETAHALAQQSLRQPADQAAGVASRAYRLHRGAGGDDHEPDLFKSLFEPYRQLVEAAPAAPAAGEAVRVLGRFTDAVRAVAIAPDGRSAALGTDAGEVALVDLETPGSPPVRLAALPAEIRTLAWSDDRRLAVGDLAGTIRLWHLDRPAAERPPSAEYADGGGAVRALVFAGALLISGSADGAVRLRPDAGRGEAAQLLVAGSGPGVLALALSDDRRLAAGRQDGVILILDLPGAGSSQTVSSQTVSSQTVSLQTLTAAAAVRALAWSPDGVRLAAGTEDGLLLYAPGHDEAPIALGGHTAPVSALSWTGGRLASASLDGSVRVWPLGTLEQRAAKLDRLRPLVLDDHGDWVWAVALTPDGEWALSGGADQRLRMRTTQIETLAASLCRRPEARCGVALTDSAPTKESE